MSEYHPSLLRDLFVLTAILAVGIAAGWKCCRWWHSRKPKVTPEQRAECIDYMNSHRCLISDQIDKTFVSGIEVGKRLNLS